jgi:hypothetical protein
MVKSFRDGNDLPSLPENLWRCTSSRTAGNSISMTDVAMAGGWIMPAILAFCVFACTLSRNVQAGCASVAPAESPPLDEIT